MGLLADSVGVYRDERLALERPGWVWQDERDKISKVINPSETALDLLAEVREEFPWAELVSVRFDEDHPCEWHEAVSVTDPFGLADRCPRAALRFVEWSYGDRSPLNLNRSEET